MRTTHREFILDLLSGLGGTDPIPESLASDEEAIDWLLYLLHEVEYPAAGLIEFLGKHHSNDRRFKLWKDRAFRPCLGEDGMESETAFRYMEKWNPAHPWLDAFMQQAAYSFACATDFMFLGKDFWHHLKDRYSKLIGESKTATDMSPPIAAMETMDLESIAEDTAATINSRLATLDELARREKFDCFFRTNLPYEFTLVFLEGAKKRGTPALRSAAQSALSENKHLSLAFEVLLAPEISASGFLELLQFARQMNWPSRSLFLSKIMEPGCHYPEETIRSTAMDITREDTYSRRTSIPFLLGRFRHDEEVIALIKSCATKESDDYRFSQILSGLLDHGIEPEWVRSSALAFRAAHDDCRSTYHVLARIGDTDCTQVILNAFESPIPLEQRAAIQSAGRHLHDKPNVREALLEQARAGHTEACKWIIRHYPEDSRTLEILGVHLEGPESYRYFTLVPLMCLQGMMLGKFREWLIRSIQYSSCPYGYSCNAVLAIRTERELLGEEICVHWENLTFQHHRLSSLCLIWFPVQPLMTRIIDRLRTGDFLDNPREILLHISEHTEIAEALREGIIAAAPHEQLTDAILVLGLIYGDRPETLKFLKDYVKLDPSQRKYGSEVAFAEALRLGKRDQEDFEWALEAMAASSPRNNGGLANHAPRLLAHFFGLTSEVRNALELFSRSSSNPVLADSSRALLMEKFPGHLPDLSRQAVSIMPVERRMKHLLQLARSKPPQIQELKDFALHDPAVQVRKDALTHIVNSMRSSSAREAWGIADFALECLKDSELANLAAKILADYAPQNERFANELLSAHARFLDAGIILPLAQSFGEIPMVRSVVYEFMTSLRGKVPSPNPTHGCDCKVCIGFDIKIYSSLTVSLHSPPFREDHMAAILRKDTFHDPRIDPYCDTRRILEAETQALEATERSTFLEQIARSDAHLQFRKAACESLARMAEKDEEPLERLLAMMREDDMELKNLAKKACASNAVNTRRCHRALQTLMKP